MVPTEAAGPLVTHAFAWLISSHSRKHKDVKQEQQAYLGSPPGPLILLAAVVHRLHAGPTWPADAASKLPLLSSSIYLFWFGVNFHRRL